MSNRWHERWEKRRNDICAKFHKNNAYSMEAFHMLPDELVRQQKMWIIAYIREQEEKGATCQETEVAVRMEHTSCSARISELKELALLEWDPAEWRPTRSGRRAQVYRVAAELKQSR